MNFGRIGKMKYIEELSNGDFFKYEHNFYLLGSDFKKNGDRLSYSLNSGFPLWVSNQTVVEKIELYTLDVENNVIPIKTTDVHKISSVAYQ